MTDKPSVALTTGELEAATLYGRGLKIREIAKELGRLANTVRDDLASARKKLGARNVIALAVMVAVQRDRQKRAQG